MPAVQVAGPTLSPAAGGGAGGGGGGGGEFVILPSLPLQPVAINDTTSNTKSETRDIILIKSLSDPGHYLEIR
jgi:hypothetical protein